MLGAACKLPPSVILEHNRVFGQFKGALTEQFVQQQLRAECGITPFYWAAERAQAEVDFVIDEDYSITPIEVKAERNLQAKSLRSFCKRYNSKLAVRTSMAEYGVSSVTLPAGKGGEPEPSFTIVDIPLYAIAALPAELTSLRH